MPGQTRPVADERDGLLSFLSQVRHQLKLTGFGLTPEQLRATPSASALSVGGLIKHAAYTEAGWLDTAAAEGWPESDYLKPWTPPVAQKIR